MSRILFLTFDYPYSHFGASDQCSVKLMEALSRSGKHEIHNISFDGKQKHYRDIKGVFLHILGFPEKMYSYPRWIIHLLLLLKLPFYPFTKYLHCRKTYHACVPILKKNHYDLVIAQCNPEESVWVGTWLKKAGLCSRIMVIFWDNIYGKLPRRFIPKQFAIHRQQIAENYIAKYADSIVSLYPLKTFHEKFGDVPNAARKRVYLGIPSIIRPYVFKESSFKNVIKDGMINMLFSGTVFRKEYVSYLIELINQTSVAEKVNLIFFCKGVDKEDLNTCQQLFKGTVFFSGWIPVEELLALYSRIDFFISFPGNPASICSKVYEYMSYGHPLILLYDDDTDVNVRTFSSYPAFIAVDERKNVTENSKAMERFIEQNKDTFVPFEKVEELFPYDSVSVYLQLIEEIIAK